MFIAETILIRDYYESGKNLGSVILYKDYKSQSWFCSRLKENKIPKNEV